MKSLLRRMELQIPMRENQVPLMMEFPVDPLSFPVLVSSSKSLVWIKPKKKREVVRAAIRSIESYGGFFREVLDVFWNESVQSRWGSALPLSESGIDSAFLFLEEMGHTECEVLCSEDLVDVIAPWVPETFFIEGVSWLDSTQVVVVPVNRDYLGWIYEFPTGQIVSVIHNAVRGMCVLREMSN